MNLKDILLSAGASVFKNIVPGGSVIIDVINDALPADKKLNKDATGTDIQSAINSLTPEQQSSLLEKEYDVEIAEINNWSKVQASLSEADQAGASSRPKIAMMMASMVVLSIVLFMSLLSYSIFKGNTEMVKLLGDSWPMIVAILGTPTTLLTAYFGMRTKEKKARYAAASGQPISGIAGLLNLIK